MSISSLGCFRSFAMMPSLLGVLSASGRKRFLLQRRGTSGRARSGQRRLRQLNGLTALCKSTRQIRYLAKPPERAAITVLPWAVAALLTSVPDYAEVSVDWLYDFRHATDPQDNVNNFPVVELKAFVPQSFGSFLMKEEIDLNGTNHNESKNYTELSQSIKLGDVTLRGLPLFAHVGYSGGLGLFGNATGGFYVQNTYNVGLEYPFGVQEAFCNVFVALRYTNFTRPSYDPMLSIYAGRYFLNYKLLVANSLEAWTTAYDHGDAASPRRAGRFASWELESEVWYKVAKGFSVGTYIRSTRNVYALSNRWLLFPSLGVRYAL